MTGPPVLWHFPISHYNEKARWALDWKGIPHLRRALALSYMTRRASSRRAPERAGGSGGRWPC